MLRHSHSSFFFFNDTATTEIYTLSLHDALPISPARRDTRSRAPGRHATGNTMCTRAVLRGSGRCARPAKTGPRTRARTRPRSEEHTSELQSPCNLVCRLLLEKKKKKKTLSIATN